MSPTKCPACGQRILNPSGIIRCPNCGASLMPQITMSPYSPDTHDDFSPPPEQDNQPPASEAFDRNQEDTIPTPTPPVPVMTAYPKDFPKSLPDCEGTVILLDSHEEPKRSSGVSEIAFNTLMDFIWSIPGGAASGTTSSKEKEKVQVTRIRIRDDNGSQNDARLEGRLTGVNVAQGDRISLWGKDKDGLLAFKYGYNHTSKGPIRTSKAKAQVNIFVFMLVVLGGIIAAIFMMFGGHKPF